MDRLDADTWCDECGELGWEGTCPACVEFAGAPPSRPPVAGAVVLKPGALADDE